MDQILYENEIASHEVILILRVVARVIGPDGPNDDTFRETLGHCPGPEPTD